MQLAAAHERAYAMIEELLPYSDWQVSFDRSRSHAGITNFKKGIIYLSIPFVLSYSEYEFEQLMLHEIAHVRVGPGKDHGREWQKEARELGYEGKATVTGLESRGDAWWRPWGGTLAIAIGIMTMNPIFGGIAGGIWLTVAAVKIWQRWGPVPEMYKPLKER